MLALREARTRFNPATSRFVEDARETNPDQVPPAPQTDPWAEAGLV